MDDERARVLSGPESAWLDEDAAAAAEARKAAFWEVLHRLAAEYEVEVVLKPRRSAARWDDRRRPPRLLAATVRFEQAGYRRRRS